MICHVAVSIQRMRNGCGIMFGTISNTPDLWRSKNRFPTGVSDTERHFSAGPENLRQENPASRVARRVRAFSAVPFVGVMRRIVVLPLRILVTSTLVPNGNVW